MHFFVCLFLSGIELAHSQYTCPPNNIAKDKMIETLDKEGVTTSLFLNYTLISDDSCFIISGPLSRDCWAFCHKQPGCLTFSFYLDDLICRIYTVPLSAEAQLVFKPLASTGFYCGREQILPTLQNELIDVPFNPLQRECQEDGFITTNDTAIDPTGSSLVSFIVKVPSFVATLKFYSCSETCAVFGDTCSGYSLLGDECTLYTGEIENARSVSVEGAISGISCDVSSQIIFTTCPADGELTILNAAVDINPNDIVAIHDETTYRQCLRLFRDLSEAAAFDIFLRRCITYRTRITASHIVELVGSVIFNHCSPSTIVATTSQR